MVFPKGSVLSPVLFNIYTNDQTIHKGTQSFINADDLCIATQDASFEKTESTLKRSTVVVVVCHGQVRRQVS